MKGESQLLLLTVNLNSLSVALQTLGQHLGAITSVSSLSIKKDDLLTPRRPVVCLLMLFDIIRGK